MRTVLQFLAAYTAVCRRASDGIRDFATRSGWRLHVVPYANAADREDDRFGNMRDAMALDALLKEWRPDGCIIHWSLVWPDLAKSLRGIPCVTIDGADDLPAVCLDNAAIGRAAAKELLRLSPASLAYLSIHRPTYWCDERTAAFAATVRANGARAVDLGETGESVNSVSGRLVEALRRLPKPCGLFAVNDIVARRAAEAAEVAGLDIPCDLAIVGADDDELVCEGPGPTLSSVRPDFWGLGHEAAAMLDRLMDGASAAPVEGRKSKVESPDARGGRVSPRAAGGGTRSAASAPAASAASILRVGGETVVRRASSRRLLLGDPLVSATLEDIRLHYAEPITAASLARRHGVGLRTLELRFLRAKGRTIGREISDTRFHAAQDLLSAREWRSIEAIANFCGYDCDSTLRKAFSARLGLSPSAWRNAEKKR
ncbi:MAG: substrate-binding domain-containing protein [Kiritimatiellae bacterium]|nr:substrate-binding domain-containing protein [Kiritimatiellia bacterium]